jgi:hypothetical protein
MSEKNENNLFNRLKNESLPTKVSMITNVVLYLLVSIVSMFHAYKFFLEATSIENKILAILTTIAFEIGQVASLFSLNTLNKSNKGLIWFLFLFLTFVQVISNIGYGYYNISLDSDLYFKSLTDFFSFIPSVKPYLKHIFTVIYSGSLPIIAVLFIKSLINYIAPSTADNFLSKVEEKKKDKAVNIEDDFLFGDEQKEDIKKEVEKIEEVEDIKEEPIKEDIKEEEIIQEDLHDEKIEEVEEEKEPEEVAEELISSSAIEDKAPIKLEEGKDKDVETVRIKVKKDDSNGKINHRYRGIDKEKVQVF